MRPRPAISFVMAASLSLGGGVAPAAQASQTASAGVGGHGVRVGQAEDLTHIEFRGVEPRRAQRLGDVLVLHFAAAPPDLAALQVTPPRFVRSVASTSDKSGAEVRLTLDPGAVAKVGHADGAAFVDLYAAPAPPPKPPDQTPERTGQGGRADPAPASGALKMSAALQGGQLVLRFPWRAPLGAAAFRRGDAIWLVFDTKADIDLSEAPVALPLIGPIARVESANATAIRIAAPPTTAASLTADGATWTLTLGPAASASPTPVQVKADPGATPPTLSAEMAGATGVFWFDDPAVGDRLAVVTALGPAKGAPVARAFVDATLLPSVQGLAIQPNTGDLMVSTDGDVVRIARPNGLALSPASGEARRAAPPADLPQPTALPALIDFDGWSRTGPGGFLARYDQLMSGAADEAAKGKAAGVQARFGLARFLVGSELSFEAIGLLDLLAKQTPALLQDPTFRGLRGAARAMAGRYKDAEADFSAPQVSNDPASALWRSYISSKLGDNVGARQQFQAGRSALALFAPKWRARFARADAEAALATGDLAGARADLASLGMAGLEPVEADALRLDQARLDQAAGQTDAALALFKQVQLSPYGALAAPALLHATEIELNAGRIKPDDAVATLDSLRFRWRGDATELDTVRALGRIYLSQGRYRDALEALSSASRSLADLPAAAAIQGDLDGAFRGLFLNGGADGLPPVQALGLFLDFKDLTPIGEDGDMMVRKLARRLVDVDLLDQAATLLKYQADNRLDGIPRAEVDTDLALIELMDKQPEGALDAINASRSTLLPRELAERRRVLEARALCDLGRYDDAREFLGADTSPDATDVRADVAWASHDWARAAAILEGQLGDRWRSDLPLAGVDQARLMRAAVAFSLADDDAGLARLRARYTKLADGAPAANALRVALAGAGSGPYAAADYVRAISDTDAFEGWVAAMKTRYLSGAVG